MNEMNDIRQRDIGLTATASNDRSVGKVAMEAIQRRIEDLQKCFKRVSQPSSQEVDADESVHKHADESVHKLRVSLRRAIAALEFFREWVPSRSSWAGLGM
jgi:CHAD domain-containing protein